LRIESEKHLIHISLRAEGNLSSFTGLDQILAEEIMPVKSAGFMNPTIERQGFYVIHETSSTDREYFDPKNPL
jgi:hypothetical protein